MSFLNSSSVRIAFQPPDVLLDLLDQPRRAAVLRDDRDERAADDRGVGVGADFSDVLGPRDAEPQAIGIDVCARIRRTSASAPAATLSRAPVTPRREIP